MRACTQHPIFEKSLYSFQKLQIQRTSPLTSGTCISNYQQLLLVLCMCQSLYSTSDFREITVFLSETSLPLSSKVALGKQLCTANDFCNILSLLTLLMANTYMYIHAGILQSVLQRSSVFTTPIPSAAWEWSFVFVLLFSFQF